MANYLRGVRGKPAAVSVRRRRFAGAAQRSGDRWKHRRPRAHVRRRRIYYLLLCYSSRYCGRLYSATRGPVARTGRRPEWIFFTITFFFSFNFIDTNMCTLFNKMLKIEFKYGHQILRTTGGGRC